MAPRIFLFSIVLGDEYSFYVKSIATYAPTFLGYNNLVLAMVTRTYCYDALCMKWSEQAYEILHKARFVLYFLKKNEPK